MLVSTIILQTCYNNEGGIALKHIFFYYRDIIYNLYQEMSTYNSQLKKKKKIFCNPHGVNGAPYVLKLYAYSGINISKCIEGGSIKLTTLVDYIYIYICVQSQMHFHVINVIFFKLFFGGI